MPGGDRPQRWESVGATGRFRRVRLPLSDDALTLNGGRQRFLVYGEFDTGLEPEAWGTFVFDPLKVLSAEGLLDDVEDEHPHLQVNIIKLTGPEVYEEAYESETRQRGERSAELYRAAEVSDDMRRDWYVSTSVVNHEAPLNPRIGLSTIVI
jgi:hypothetical protein